MMKEIKKPYIRVSNPGAPIIHYNVVLSDGSFGIDRYGRNEFTIDQASEFLLIVYKIELSQKILKSSKYYKKQLDKSISKLHSLIEDINKNKLIK